MYAIIQSGSKQYRVKKDDVIDVELLEASEGQNIEFDHILFVGGDKPELGAPSVPHFVVKAEVLGLSAGPKLSFMKYRPSHNERKKYGHRQKYSRVKITAIEEVKKGK
jgi:large subunit ribosomal protein L21